jgi:hypothetical protein
VGFSLGDLGKNLRLGEHIIGTGIELATRGKAALHVVGIHLDVPGIDPHQEYEIVGVLQKREKLG